MVFWFGGNAADINRMFVLQKRAVKAIYNLGLGVSLTEKITEFTFFFNLKN